MFQTDQTHLRKYVTTLGVAITAGTLTLAGLFLKLQQDLLITKSTLGQVTPTARTALLRRQEYLSIGTSVLPWFVLIGFVGGISLSIYGVIGWAKRQKVIDEREDIGLRKERVELLQLTDAEKADKLERDAKETVKDSPPISAASSRAQLADVREELANLENALTEKLRSLYGHYVSPQVGILTPDQRRFDIDALVQPSDPSQPRIIFELKYSRTLNGVDARIAAGLRQVATILRFTNGRGVLVMIIPDTADIPQVVRLNIRAAEMASVYQAQILAHIRRYSDFLAETANEFATQLHLENFLREPEDDVFAQLPEDDNMSDASPNPPLP
jgi:hypothetical protein